jgi:hypothetical protein
MLECKRGDLISYNGVNMVCIGEAWAHPHKDTSKEPVRWVLAQPADRDAWMPRKANYIVQAEAKPPIEEEPKPKAKPKAKAKDKTEGNANA